MRVGIENHGGRHHRTGERPPARLVAAGDRKDALRERAPFAPEARAQHGFLAAAGAAAVFCLGLRFGGHARISAATRGPKSMPERSRNGDTDYSVNVS